MYSALLLAGIAAAVAAGLGIVFWAKGPSYSLLYSSLAAGDLVEVRERSKSLEVITNSLSLQGAKKYNWLEWDNSEMTGKLIHVPVREDIPENINEQLIVELYSK